jgi:hypothetical protein
MKNRFITKLAGSIAVVALLLLPGSCLEYFVNTSVNRDGSITREYTVRGDSSSIFNGSLRIPSGIQWKISQRYEENDKKKDSSDKQYVYTASRKFETIKQFQDWLSSDTDSNTIKIQVNLKKHFRWFYTYFEYTETYPMSFPFRNVPVDSFLTETEQSVLTEDSHTVYSPVEKKWIWKSDTIEFKYNHADSIEMKNMEDRCGEKLELWMTSAIVSEFADIVKNIFAKDPSFSNIRLKLSQHIEMLRNKAFLSNDSTLTSTLILLVDSLTQTAKASELFAQNPSVLSDFENKLKIVDKNEYSDDYEYRLSMPGQVFSTNAIKRGPASLSWKFGPMRFFIKDFEMKAESRAANPWIMAFTLLLSVFLIWILFVKKR